MVVCVLLINGMIGFIFASLQRVWSLDREKKFYFVRLGQLYPGGLVSLVISGGKSSFPIPAGSGLSEGGDLQMALHFPLLFRQGK